MAEGYDFTLYEDEEIAAQRDAARMAEEWLYLDEKSMSGELNGLNSRVSACIKQLSQMISDNDYKKTKDMLDTLVVKDLSSEGWLFSFSATNQDAFSDKTRSEMYPGLKPEEKKIYDTAEKYYADIKYLLPAGTALYDLLLALPLEDGFRLLRIKDNFESAGFSQSLYKRIDEEIKSVSEILSKDWNELERGAQKSKQFIDDNLSKLPKGELEKGYKAERVKDFQQVVRFCEIINSLTEISDGHYSVRPNMLAISGVIDKYTYEVSQTADLKDKMQKVISGCRNIMDGDISNAEKNCKIQASQFLCAAFRTLAETISAFASSVMDTYVKFKEKNDEAPYCFMKKLSALGSPVYKYDFKPNTSDPWDSGTYYKDLYQEAAAALSTQCRFFVDDHGATFA